MASLSTKAVVLRHADYNDYDRMLTLFSPTMGLVTAAVRGCRRPKAKTLACTELFACGEYVLYAKGDRYTVTSFALQDAFYPLRLDVDRLSHGVYMLNLCEAVVQPGEGEEALFLHLLRALAVLAYGEADAHAVTAAFALLLMTQIGFAPALENCLACGKPAADDAFFALDLGGMLCPACHESGAATGHAWQQVPERAGIFRQRGAARRAEAAGQPVRLGAEALAFLRAVKAQGLGLLTGMDASEVPGARDALILMRDYVEAHVEKRVKSAKFLL